MLACVYDEDLRRRLNGRRMNYWDVYLAEMCDLLGLRPERRSMADLESPSALEGIETLLIGACSGDAISAAARGNIAEWVRGGGTLIGFAVDGLDEVFGIERLAPAEVKGGYTSPTRILQGSDDWTIAGYFDLRSHCLTREVHHLLFLDQKLPILSDVSVAWPRGATELAVLFDAGGRCLRLPAITWNECGRGHAGWFAFDAAKTVWLLHQGRPAPDHPEDGKFPRAHDMSVLGGNSRLVPYADEVCWLLRNMIAVKPHPFLAETPPLDGAPSDAALYYGGDEYSGPTDLSIRAAQFMRGLGLPYQTNIESDRHPMTAEEHARIRNLGTEVSAYYHLYEDDGFTMKPEHYRRQSDRFFERFGYRPVATVNHCIRWKGWTEPARWMLAAGGRADNGFSCKGVPNDNHFRNSASYGFSFGTCYPFYFWDDWRGGNERIDFMEQPIVCYELGHRGTTSVHRDLDSQAREEMHLALGMAIKNHFLMNMFYHPQPIVTMPNCREAIREVLRYVEYRGARVKHMNNRQAAEWWDARHASEVRGIVLSADALRFVCVSRWADGVTVKVPVPDGRRARVTVGGRQAAVEERIELGRAWCWFVAPAGESDIEVRFEE